MKTQRIKPTYCINCRYRKRGNTWKEDFCRAKKKLCCVVRGGYKPTLVCGEYKVQRPKLRYDIATGLEIK